MWTTILAFIGPVLVRVLSSLSIGLVAYTGFNALANRLINDAVTGLNSMPSQVLQWAGLLGVDKFISIIMSALLARFAIRGLNAIGVKKI